MRKTEASVTKFMRIGFTRGSLEAKWKDNPPGVPRSASLRTGTLPALTANLCLPLLLSDFRESDRESGAAQSFNQRAVLGVEVADAIDDRRIRVVCLRRELLNSFGRNFLSLFGRDLRRACASAEYAGESCASEKRCERAGRNRGHDLVDDAGFL